jgi:hypothetical protein
VFDLRARHGHRVAEGFAREDLSFASAAVAAAAAADNK